MSNTYTFESCGASVIQGGPLGELYVQAIDSYCYQRELSLKKGPAGTYELHAYMHPGLRQMSICDEKTGKKFIEKFLNLIREYPDLMFNKVDCHARPKNEGFVRFHNELLLWGRSLSEAIENL